ncbi:LysM peptidoglycan-binding domain-containing protein [Actinophytocola sp. KF-1]
MPNAINLANLAAGNAKAQLSSQTGGMPVVFTINPKSVTIQKTNSTEGNRAVISSSFQDALKATSNVKLELKEAHVTGMGITQLAANQLIDWATPVQITAAQALDLGSVSAAAAKLTSMGGGGTNSTSSTKDTRGAALLARPVYYRLPVLLFSWGIHGPRGSNLPVTLEKVTVEYQRFDPLGIPVWAKFSLTLVEYTAPKPRTNPTSGGVPGRATHTLSQGENVVQIANRAYGSPNAWRAVAEANGIDDPLRVRPGRTLSLPPAETVDAAVREEEAS